MKDKPWLVPVLVVVIIIAVVFVVWQVMGLGRTKVTDEEGQEIPDVLEMPPGGGQLPEAPRTPPPSGGQ